MVVVLLCTLFRSLGKNGIGASGATALADALRVNQSCLTLKHSCLAQQHSWAKHSHHPQLHYSYKWRPKYLRRSLVIVHKERGQWNASLSNTACLAEVGVTNLFCENFQTWELSLFKQCVPVLFYHPCTTALEWGYSCSSRKCVPASVVIIKTVICTYATT